MKPILMRILPMAALAVLLLTSCHKVTYKVDLSGLWSYRIDSLDVGNEERWFTTTFPKDLVALPGSLSSNGKGFEVDTSTRWTGQVVDRSWYTADRYEKYRKPGDIRIPFWLQPDIHYVGAAWYQRQIRIPSGWEGRRIILTLERCHWETEVWLDGRRIGISNSLAVPHRYDLTRLAGVGDHLLTIRVDNRMIVDVGLNAHSVSDHTQGNWNGIVGHIGLEALPEVILSDISLFPDTESGSVRIAGGLDNGAGEAREVSLEFMVETFGQSETVGIPIRFTKEVPAGSEAFELNYPMGADFLFWDEFNPNLYRMRVRLTQAESGMSEEREILFGMREFKADGTRFAINGRPTFLRGTLECAIFPKTGHPPTEVAEWQRIYRIIKSHGLNHMRFHSWCPPEAAFVAADIEGIYLYVEAGAWTTVGSGNSFDEWLYAESERIISEYGNHPSFVLYSYGNEPGGQDQVAFLEAFVTHWKSRDPRRLYTSASGWPAIPSADFHCRPEPRIQRWGEGLNSIINARPPQTRFDFADILQQFGNKPVVSHEIGQWCVYPDFKEIKDYTGYLKPKNFTIFQESLEAAHLGHLADSFLLASGKLQALCYKADIEAALRTPGMAGFELLDLHDFPGQGTALVGVLNALWNEKGYITPEQYSQFCNAVVPLARMDQMVYPNSGSFSADLEIANYGPSDLEVREGPVRILDGSGNPVYQTRWQAASVPTGTNTGVGRVEWPLEGVATASKFTLEIQADSYLNQWDFWVYPVEMPGDKAEPVPVFREVTPALRSLLESGGTAILSPDPSRVAPAAGGAVAFGFSPIFWNTAWTSGQAPHTLGILCNPSHPALRDFPTEYHTNYQWWDVVANAKPFIINNFDLQPTTIVRVIDDWFTNRDLALIFEVAVGNGKLIVSGADLISGLDNRPATRQLRRSLQTYAASPAFQPAGQMTQEQLEELFAK
ncbi:MAG: glycoside hydrolase family 2 TIM barrel-domain containing protein [Bacteroidales bacterium]